MQNSRIIETIARACETPCYLFDEGELARRVNELGTFLPEGARLCYAMKANPFVLEAASAALPLIEACSPGEIEICRRLGVPDEKLVISGVHKDAAIMEELVCSHEDIHRFTVESVTQFELLETLSCDAGKKLPLLFRLTSGNQFGMDVEEVRRIVRGLGAYPSVDFRGVQFFSGTQKSSPKRIRREISMLDELLAELAESTDANDLELEYGPGLPVEYCREDGAADSEHELVATLGESLADMTFGGAVTLEVGRFIAASCGMYVTSVVDVKRNCGQNYAIVDGGKHQIAYYGPLLAMKSPAFRVLGEPLSRRQDTWAICGSLCTSGDTLVKQAPVGELRVGDRIAFPNAGAYCMTEGMALFLSRDLPRIYLYGESGDLRLARPRIETSSLNAPRRDL